MDMCYMERNVIATAQQIYQLETTVNTRQSTVDSLTQQLKVTSGALVHAIWEIEIAKKKQNHLMTGLIE